MSALTSLYNDYYGYFKDYKDGEMDFVNGKLSKQGNNATYTPNNGGKAVTFSAGQDPYALYQASPDIAKAWEDTYGSKVFEGNDPTKSQQNYTETIYGPSNPVSPYQPAIDAVENNAGPRSGLPDKYQESLLSSIIPQLLKASETYKSDVDKGTEAAQGMYKNITDQMTKSTLPGILNDLASRNVLNSSVASDAISKTQSQIADQAATQAYKSGIDATQMKANYPSILASIASLGSSSTNDLSKYELLSNMLLNY